MNFNEIIQSKEYEFLRTNEHLCSNIILLGLGGSHAYGTNNEDSDVDIRGIALNSKEEILTNENFEQFIDKETDTTIYSFNKMIQLLSNSNPNIIEILGLKPEHYLQVSPIGQEVLDNKDLFISQKCVNTFGGYARQQFYRLKQLSKNSLSQDELEKHILGVVDNVNKNFPEKFKQYNQEISLYIGDSEREDMDTEILMDVNFKGYPLRDYCGMWSELQQVTKNYNKIGHRNKEAMMYGKIAKHMMHLVRLYLMCFDILEKGEIITYREKDHDFLMEIRNGKYIDSNNQVKDEFFVLTEELENKFQKLQKTTEIPKKPDYKKIKKFMMSVNERVVLGEI